MADSEYTDDETEYESPSSQPVVKDALLAPLRALVSPTALRIYLNTLLFIGTAVFLFGISGMAYTIFYLKFIPTVGVDREVHLQFGDGNPWGTASFESEFVSSQPYDVAVTLDLPRTPANLDVGNFMIDLTLYSRPVGSVLPAAGNQPNPIVQGRRPAILTYSSPLVDVARTVARLPFYVIGWRREAETLKVPMIEKVEFPRGARNLPQSLRLEIQSEGKMQVYSARVEFRARFTGLRWLMYRWKITSFVIFSSLFWTISMSSVGVTWLLMNWVLHPAATPKEEIKEELPETVKDEPETEDSGSSMEPVKVKKEEPEEAESSSLLQSYAEGEAAIGSGLESAEARGLQRRRSHLTESQE